MNETEVQRTQPWIIVKHCLAFFILILPFSFSEILIRKLSQRLTVTTQHLVHLEVQKTFSSIETLTLRESKMALLPVILVFRKFSNKSFVYKSKFHEEPDFELIIGSEFFFRIMPFLDCRNICGCF